jgi:hypothetical protein
MTNSLSETITLMTTSTSRYDAIIVCCSDDNQAAYWQKRLEETLGGSDEGKTMILSVTEDWSAGGAGEH